MKPIAPYLSFEGNCREAMNFYKECFGGNLEVMTWRDNPQCEVPEDKLDYVMHSELQNGGFVLLAGDRTESKNQIGNHISLAIDCDSVDEIETLFKKLGRDGEVIMPLEDTFWGARFGVVVDKFGFQWKLYCMLNESPVS